MAGAGDEQSGDRGRPPGHCAGEQAQAVAVRSLDPTGEAPGEGVVVVPFDAPPRRAPRSVCAGYAGDEVRARALLDRALAAIDVSGVVSHWGFAHYGAAELAAATDPDAAIEHYGRAIELARSSGASFIEAIASVGLVRLMGGCRSGRSGPRGIPAAARRPAPVRALDPVVDHSAQPRGGVGRGW
jgi:tetratricopeptide (TPR) repeat protein